MSNTTPAPQLPVDVVKEIKAKAIDYASSIVFNSAWMNAEKIAEKRTEASVDYQAGATEYATKLHQVQAELDKTKDDFRKAIDKFREATLKVIDAKEQVEKERDELRQWKIEAVELQIPIIAYCHKHLEVSIGDSCTALVINELDRLRKENDKLKEQAVGWRPLLEEILEMDKQDIAYISEDLVNKITKFLYGE